MIEGAITKINELKTNNEEALTSASEFITETTGLAETQLADLAVLANESMAESADKATDAVEDGADKAKEKAEEAARTLNDAFRDLGQYLDGDFQTAVAGAAESLNELLSAETSKEKFAAALGMADALAGAIANAGEFIDEVAQKVEQRGAGAAVESAGALTMKVGKALLNAGPGSPLAIAGAALVAAGLIGKIIGKIAQAIHGQKQSESELAEERLAAEEALIDLQQKRLEGMQKLIALGNTELDQAHEQLAARQKIMEARLLESGLARDLADLSAEALATEIERAEVTASAAEKAAADAEALIEDSNRRERRQFLEAQGIEVKRTTNTKKLLREFLDSQKAGLADANALIANGNALYEDRIATLELEKQIIEETIDLLEFQALLEGESLANLQKVADQRRVALEDMLALIDPAQMEKVFFQFPRGTFSEEVDTAFKKARAGQGAWEDFFATLSDEQLKDYLLRLSKLPGSELSDEIQKAGQAWLVAGGNVDDYNESLQGTVDTVEELFQKQKRLLEQQRDLNEITETEFQERTLELIDAEIARLETIKDSFATVMDFNLAINDLELERLRLLEQQNGALLDSDPILAGLVRKRQELLALIRAEGGVAAASPARRAELEQIKQDILAQMQAAGATPAQIQAMLESLPKFHRGGLVTQPGESAALLKEGEFIVEPRTVEQIGAQRLPAALDMLASPEARVVSGGLMRRETAMLTLNQAINMGGVSINNDFRNTDAARGATVMSEQLATYIVSVINRGIKSGEVRGNLQ